MYAHTGGTYMIIGETIFDILYLLTVITIGIKMLKNSPYKSQYWLFGLLAVILGFGDAFHLVPRVYALWNGGTAAYPTALGFGKAVTSVTMTIFYVMLYHVWEMRYSVKNCKNIKSVIYILAAVRIILCLFPQNNWLSADAPLSWGIYRNIPFALLGMVIIILYYRKAKEYSDKEFSYMWLAILLSFGFYIPVVLFADAVPAVGALMLPKTCAYVWAVFMGYSAMKNSVHSKVDVVK